MCVCVIFHKTDQWLLPYLSHDCKHFSSTSADEWQNFSNDNINNAETEIQSSVSLRSHIDAILQQTSNDQGRQVSATNLAFDKRIAECKDVKGKLESHVNRVSVQPGAIRQSIHCPALDIMTIQCAVSSKITTTVLLSRCYATVTDQHRHHATQTQAV